MNYELCRTNKMNYARKKTTAHHSYHQYDATHSIQNGYKFIVCDCRTSYTHCEHVHTIRIYIYSVPHTLAHDTRKKVRTHIYTSEMVRWGLRVHRLSQESNKIGKFINGGGSLGRNRPFNHTDSTYHFFFILFGSFSCMRCVHIVQHINNVRVSNMCVGGSVSYRRGTNK